MGGNDGVVTTEISVEGANCGLCFNETSRALKAEPGVTTVDASIAGQCFRIDHDDGIDAARLLAVVSEQLHGDDVSSSEHTMVAVDAKIVSMGCTHGHHALAPGGEA